MARGADLVFSTYLGFDMVACLLEEVEIPEQNMLIGIIESLLISMSIYIAVSFVIVEISPMALLGEEVPIINALLANACCSHSNQLGFDAAETCLLFGCSSITHPVLYYGSCVIFYSMSVDRLLSQVYAQVQAVTGVPTIRTILTGILTAFMACFIDLASLANAMLLSTLQVLRFVNAGMIILRIQPTLETADLLPDFGINGM